MFVAMEKTEEDYRNFTKDMPWLCVPFADVRIADLKDFYKVRSLPQIMRNSLPIQRCSSAGTPSRPSTGGKTCTGEARTPLASGWSSRRICDSLYVTVRLIILS